MRDGGRPVYAITTSSLFLAAGGGWKASLWCGDYAQKIGGTVVAALIVVLAQRLSSGFSVGLFGHAMSGTAWGWVGFILCFVFATRKLAGQSAPLAAAQPSPAGTLGELMEKHPTALMGTSKLPAPKQTMKAV